MSRRAQWARTAAYIQDARPPNLKRAREHESTTTKNASEPRFCRWMGMERAHVWPEEERNKLACACGWVADGARACVCDISFRPLSSVRCIWDLPLLFSKVSRCAARRTDSPEIHPFSTVRNQKRKRLPSFRQDQYRAFGNTYPALMRILLQSMKSY